MDLLTLLHDDPNVEVYLDAPCVLTLRLCCRGARDATEVWRASKIFTRRLEARVQQILRGGLDWPRFCAWLQEHQAVMAGSLLFGALTNWNTEGLDVFSRSPLSLADSLGELVNAPFCIDLNRETGSLPDGINRSEIIMTGRGDMLAIDYLDNDAPVPMLTNVDVAFAQTSFDGKVFMIHNVESLRTKTSAVFLHQRAGSAPDWLSVCHTLQTLDENNFTLLVELRHAGGWRLRSGGRDWPYKFVQSSELHLFKTLVETFCRVELSFCPDKKTCSHTGRTWRGLALVQDVIEQLTCHLSDAEAVPIIKAFACQ